MGGRRGMKNDAEQRSLHSLHVSIQATSSVQKTPDFEHINHHHFSCLVFQQYNPMSPKLFICYLVTEFL